MRGHCQEWMTPEAHAYHEDYDVPDVDTKVTDLRSMIYVRSSNSECRNKSSVNELAFPLTQPHSCRLMYALGKAGSTLLGGRGPEPGARPSFSHMQARTLSFQKMRQLASWLFFNSPNLCQARQACLTYFSYNNKATSCIH